CQRNRKVPKAFCNANDMDPGGVPPELQGLTQVEQILIAIACAIMRVYRLKGGQTGFSGPVVDVFY
ncbi:unnamed protein product, partial [Scytosiphon promiscuus]